MVEPIKSIVPQTFERFDPVIEITDHRGVDRIDPLTPFGPNAYELDGTQNAEMLRDLGLGETQQLDEIVHRQRFVGERFENVAAYLFGYGSGTAAEAPNGARSRAGDTSDGLGARREAFNSDRHSTRNTASEPVLVDQGQRAVEFGEAASGITGK